MKKPTQPPEHKPNPRHALNEVMHGLQDVLNNELGDVADDNEGVASGPEPEPEPETILGSLRSFLGGSRKKASISKPEPRAASRTHDLDAPADEKPESPPGFGPQDDRRDVGHTVRLDATPETPVDPEDFTLEILHAPAEPPARAVPPKEESPAPGNAARARVSQLEIAWDDIPVLNEVVMPPPEKFQGTITPEVRDIAIKVAAALNIELKRAGKQTLDVKMIMQLQNLLQKEISASGMSASGISNDARPKRR